MGEQLMRAAAGAASGKLIRWEVAEANVAAQRIGQPGLKWAMGEPLEQETLRASKTVHGPALHPDVIITTGGEVFRDLAAGRSTLAEAINNGAGSASGDQHALRRLHQLFSLPRPQTRSAAKGPAS
ncbi:hypothetical protein [Nonomuraea sp. NPDC049480]|uniref:hypothetical protein n=1 Tax=Nonomuraea sp. NPDC049480 TaxID=3364353 RepID=UPI0037A1E061